MVKKMSYVEDKIFNENIEEIVKSLDAYFRNHARHVIEESKGEQCPFGCVITHKDGVSFILVMGGSRDLLPIATVAHTVSETRTPVEGCHKIQRSGGGNK